MPDEILELRKLSKTFREGETERAVFNAVDTTVCKGEFIVLLGRSGSGKSTLLNLISGIDLPTSGEVLIAKQNLTSMSEHQRTLFRRDHIGFIFQFYNLIPTLTVMENLLLPLELKKIKTADAQEQASKLLDQVGLLDRAKSYPDRLSGGEQQRVSICRALIHQPLLLLADEPTGNLDAETGNQILALLNQLAREHRMTTLMVTHSQEVAALADRIMTICNGRLVDQFPSMQAKP
ncbi:MAG: ABC transporter ATP-binding protein [Deltaproteobacteria bacterium]|jgi:putative ABC transport system ATP-binding protein|nr:ABC transporter ATP-binding protein [Deltaproteobacteria bacterium]